ncbi:MAG: hypothetical protein II956_16185 [Bacteroidales bacterium]|nr:hypothetical protein [Bacteroidales bacterium]
MITIKDFDQNFKTRLYNLVSEIENNTDTEAVVMIKQSSGQYFIYSLAASGIFFVVLLTYFMLSPIEYDPYLMYTFSFFASAALLAAFIFIPDFQRIIIPKKIRKKNVEIHARAIFQKAGMYKTVKNSAFLVYYSLKEKEVCFLPDVGISLVMEDNAIKEIEKILKQPFETSASKEEILNALNKIIPILAKYLPSKGKEINELPDDLDIEL